jgi:quercetin 2,3-dioxygenase
MLGVLSGGFERLFQQMGTPADSGDPEQPPFIPDFPRIQAAAGPSHAVLPGLRVA